MRILNRKPKGMPTGGEFANKRTSESEVQLEPPSAAIPVVLESEDELDKISRLERVYGFRVPERDSSGYIRDYSLPPIPGGKIRHITPMVYAERKAKKRHDEVVEAEGLEDVAVSALSNQNEPGDNERVLDAWFNANVNAEHADILIRKRDRVAKKLKDLEQAIRFASPTSLYDLEFRHTATSNDLLKARVEAADAILASVKAKTSYDNEVEIDALEQKWGFKVPDVKNEYGTGAALLSGMNLSDVRIGPAGTPHGGVTVDRITYAREYAALLEKESGQPGD